MFLIELSDYCLNATGSGNGLKNFYFTLSDGDICSIQTDSSDDAHNFLKALATLVYPVNGAYRFLGEAVNFSDYRELLPIKKKIGYIGQDSAMISNRTVRENMLLMRYYFENSLSPVLDENASKLCKMFNLQDKLDLRPGDLRPVDLRIAIAIRELSKSVDVLLLDRPEDYFGYNRFALFKEIMGDIIESVLAVVFFSHDLNFIETFSNMKILIKGGTLTKGF
jgi:ABC-type polar amino acid transport system ATPase subunit